MMLVIELLLLQFINVLQLILISDRTAIHTTSVITFQSGVTLRVVNVV
jgi:hypothetical protein